MAAKSKKKKTKMTVSQRAANGEIKALCLSPTDALTLAMCIRNCVLHLGPPDGVVTELAWIGAQLETVFGLTVCEQCNMPCFPGDECDADDSEECCK